MKNKHFLTGLAVLAMWASAPAADSSAVSTITTNRGKVYENVRIFQVDPDGVMFSHKHGGAKVLFSEMPTGLRERLGYDEDKEAAYKKDHIEKIREDRKQAMELQKEHLKAEAAANAVRLETIRQQGIAGDYPGYGYGYGAGLGDLVTPTFWDNGYGYGYGNGYGYGPGFGNAGYCGPGYPGIFRSRTTLPSVVQPGTPGIINTRSRGGYRPAFRGNVPYGIPALGNLAPALAPRVNSGGARAAISVSAGPR